MREAYSAGDRTKALNKRVNVLILVKNFEERKKKPRDLLMLDNIVEICSVKLRSYVKVTPRSRVDVSLAISELSIRYGNLKGKPDLLNDKT